MTESFLRQRRNLFIVNGILLFSYMAKVNIEKLTIAGLSFDGFEKPDVIFTFIWLMYFYFFYRFAVYFIEDESSKFANKWAQFMSKEVDSKIVSIIKNSNDNVSLLSIAGYYQTKKNSMIVTFQNEKPEDENNPYSISNHQTPILKRQIFFSQCLAIFKFCTLTSAITNYFLPVVLSLCVVRVVGFSNWSGSLLRAFS